MATVHYINVITSDQSEIVVKQCMLLYPCVYPLIRETAIVWCFFLLIPNWINVFIVTTRPLLKRITYTRILYIFFFISLLFRTPFNGIA